MSIIKTNYATLNGQNIYAYTLTNNSGLTAEILNYGGIIRRIIYKGIDVVWGRETLKDYIENGGYYGALIGRNSNRIENSEFVLNNQTYQLFNNAKNFNLHGGKEGFDKKIWNAKTVDGDEPSLILYLESPDGEEGFPGTVKVQVTYTITQDNEIKIHYLGETDKDTILNMTNHSYFNVNGHLSGNIDGQSLWINSDFYTPPRADGIPTGEILSVENTPFDFRNEAKLGERFVSCDEQIKARNGYDHNFVLNGSGYRKVAYIKGDKSGITMEVYTDRPGMQIYTRNSSKEDLCAKDGGVYGMHGAICFETQGFPNSINTPHFPSDILKAGEKYETVTVYKFI